MDSVETALPKPTLGELTAASFKIGCLGFGGPAGQIALMHRVFVDEKKWIDEERYLHALNFCMLLPGPEAQQLATYVGWRVQGMWGGIIAGALFVLPGALVVFALSALYVTAGEAPLVAAAFNGVKAAVVALVIEAMLRIGKRALKSSAAWWIAGASFLALFLWQIPFPIVILAAATLGAFLLRPAQASNSADPPVSITRTLAIAIFWIAAWLAPLALCFVLLGPDHVLTGIGQLFSTLALVTFGGAYATLAYLQQAAVDGYGWLTASQMIDGLGLAETTPGPLVLVNQFVGFLAGWGAGGWTLAVLGGLLASWATFAPSFAWIFAFAPFTERLRANRIAQGALAAITAAVLGIIAQLAVWFAAHVIFARVERAPIGAGASVPFPDWTSFDATAFILTATACIALLRFNLNVVVLVVGAAFAGAGVTLLQ